MQPYRNLLSLKKKFKVETILSQAERESSN